MHSKWLLFVMPSLVGCCFYGLSMSWGGLIVSLPCNLICGELKIFLVGDARLLAKEEPYARFLS